MGFGKPPGVPCHPNNPHCQGLEPVAASIDNPIFIIFAIVVISIYAYFVIKGKPRISKADKSLITSASIAILILIYLNL